MSSVQSWWWLNTLNINNLKRFCFYKQVTYCSLITILGWSYERSQNAHLGQILQTKRTVCTTREKPANNYIHFTSARYRQLGSQFTDGKILFQSAVVIPPSWKTRALDTCSMGSANFHVYSLKLYR